MMGTSFDANRDGVNGGYHIAGESGGAIESHNRISFTFREAARKVNKAIRPIPPTASILVVLWTIAVILARHIPFRLSILRIV